MLVMETGGWPRFSKHWALLGSEMLRDGKILSVLREIRPILLSII